MRQITTPDVAQRRAESQAAAIAARRAAQGVTPTIIVVKRMLRTDARTGHASTVAAAVGISRC